MAVPVLMPKQGQSVESCIITEWQKQVGDQVAVGDILFAYETDKASFEEEAQTEGVLLAVFFEAGDEVPVLTNVAVIGQAGESTDEFRPGGEQPVEQDESPTSEQKPQETSVADASSAQSKVPEVAQPSNDNKELRISPRAKAMAQKMGVPYQQIQGSGPYGRIIARDIEAYAQSQSLMTPLAQEKAEKEQLQASDKGSGLGGRLRAQDLTLENTIYGTDYEDQPLTNIRRLIASSMHASLQNSAQLTHHTSADARKMLSLRKQIKKDIEVGNTTDNITLNDMVCFAVVRALKKHPQCNAHFSDEYMRLFKKVHLGFAVDTPRGLMVPVVRNADDLSLGGLSSQMKALAQACQKGSVDPELLASQAASFTVSNLGAYGVELFTPVLNVPQVGILGVNTITHRPGDMGDGSIGFLPYIGLSLTYDHRAVDGAPASAFLREIKLEIEAVSL